MYKNEPNLILELIVAGALMPIGLIVIYCVCIINLTIYNQALLPAPGDTASESKKE